MNRESAGAQRSWADGNREAASENGEPGTANPESVTDQLSRRGALKAMAAAAAVPVLGTLETSEDHVLRAREAAESAVLAEMQGATYTPKFFTAHEYQTVRVLADYIIPRDGRSGSATDAGAPQYIDFVLSDQTPPPGPPNPTRRFYVAPTPAQVNIRGGLAWLDRECANRFGTGKTFLTSSDAQRRQILDDIAWPEKAKPELSHGVAFFNRMRDMTAAGFFSSKMGVQDLRYMGNVPQAKWSGCPPEALKKLGV
jgi:gluconate 2-dehydrogenase subunit 3-like protein